MYQEIEGGSVEVIQGLTCHIAKPGQLFDPITQKWVKQEIYRRHKDKAQTYWEPDPRWDKYLSWKADEDKIRKDEEKRTGKPATFVHAELSEFIQECWLYRQAGYWFYNNGVPTYITGSYWYYLSCFLLDTRKKPKYRDSHRQFYHAWQFCVEDPRCYGLNFVAKRRQGKSYMAAAIGLEIVTNSQNSHFGIQSKTESDAKMLFNKHVVTPFRSLPFFFQPNCYLPAGRTPATSLKFETGKMATDANDELQSFIDFGSSNEYFYDGHKLHFYWRDEAGKTVEINIYDGWGIAKKCLRDDEDVVIGKALYSTTVEDIENGGGNYFNLWSKSNQNERNQLGETASGLYKFFMPADETYKPNIYGFADKAEGKRVILIRREEITDPREKSKAKRMDPLDEKEAFSIDASTCVYDSEKLNAQDETLKYATPLYRIGNFQWTDGTDSDVEFVEHSNGRFQVAWEPPVEYRNRKKMRGENAYPDNVSMCAAGADPYEHAILTESSVKSMSMGALCIRKRWHPVVNDESGHYKMQFDYAPVLLYVFRPNDPEIFFEDCIKACIYYGCQVLCEDNKEGMIKHFQKRNYGAYLAWMPGRNKPGIHNGSQTAGGGTNGHIAELTDTFISHHCASVVFPLLIDQWLQFSPAKTTKFDAAMAFGFSSILFDLMGDTKSKHVKNNGKKMQLTDFFGESVKRARMPVTVGRRTTLSGW